MNTATAKAIPAPQCKPTAAAVREVGAIDKRVAALDFSRLRWKLANSGESPWPADKLATAEREYRRFLTLKLVFPKVSLVPNKLVDAFWHEHILDTAAYQRDCQAVFGRFIHHFPYFGIYGSDDKADLKRAFARSNRLYEQYFGRDPKLAPAARCQDHACHVPSECACRVEGACK